MIAGNKYDGLQVDIWSSGIILYAMLCGYLPFEDPNTTELYKKILKGKYELPDFLSKDAKDLLKKVLNTDPKKRYTIEEIRKHSWYSLVKPLEYDEGIMIGYKQVPIDLGIVSELNKYDIDPEYARKCIEANRHNDITTTYYLLIKKYQREGNKNIINPNSSLSIQKELTGSLKKVIASYETNIELEDNYKTTMNTLGDPKGNNTLETDNGYKESYLRSTNTNSWNTKPSIELATKVSGKFEKMIMNLKRHKVPVKKSEQKYGVSEYFFEDPLEFLKSDQRSSFKENNKLDMFSATNVNKEPLYRRCNMHKGTSRKLSSSVDPSEDKTYSGISFGLQPYFLSWKKQQKAAKYNISPYMTKLDTSVRLGKSSQTKKRHAKNAALQTEHRVKVKKRVDPVVMNKSVLMSTYSNYKDCNVSTGKMKNVITISRPLISHFRSRKYTAQSSYKGNKHNSSFIK